MAAPADPDTLRRPEPLSHFSSDSGKPERKRSWPLSTRRASRLQTIPATNNANHDDTNAHAASNTPSSDGPRHPHFTTHGATNTAPLPFFHPTRAALHPTIHTAAAADADGAPSKWSSRASRKNRYAPGAVRIAHSPSAADTEAAAGAEKEKEGVLVEPRVRHPQTRLKAQLTWDISFWVAVIFVLGSTAWVCPSAFIIFILPRDL
jgi:hypothetical protein